MTTVRWHTCGARLRTPIRHCRVHAPRVVPLVARVTLVAVASASALLAQGNAARPRTHRGMEISVVGIERASSAALGDCPPGANTQRAMAKAGEEFAIVTVALAAKEPAAPGPVKRPVLI